MIQRPQTEPRLGALLDIARARQSLPNALFDDQHVTLHVTKPTAVVFIGDLHLGAPGTDYARLEADVHHLAAARALHKDQLYIIGMGDYIDGYLPSGTPRNPYQVLQPDEQRQAATEVFNFIKPDLLIEGDHDLWHSQNALQHSWLFEYARDHGVQYAQWGTRLHVTYANNPRTDPWLVRHRYSGSRSQHPTGPHKKMVSELGPATLGALAHTHSFPGFHRAYSTRRAEGAFHAVQTGTYKKYDEYGKKLAAYEGEYGVPAALLTPDGTLTPYDQYEDALSQL